MFGIPEDHFGDDESELGRIGAGAGGLESISVGAQIFVFPCWECLGDREFHLGDVAALLVDEETADNTHISESTAACVVLPVVGSAGEVEVQVEVGGDPCLDVDGPFELHFVAREADRFPIRIVACVGVCDEDVGLCIAGPYGHHRGARGEERACVPRVEHL